MARDQFEYDVGGKLQDRYGREQLVLVQKHQAPLATDVQRGYEWSDEDGRPQLVLFSGATGGNILDLETDVSFAVRNGDAADPVNTAEILQGIGGYNPDGSGLPNFAEVPVVKMSTGGVYSEPDTGDNNIFQLASYVENNDDAPTVAVFGFGKGARVFGGNLVGYTNGAGGIAQGLEVDYGNVGVGETTVNGDQALPTATLTVASTTGAASTGIFVANGNYGRYTGITATTFTGITWEVGGTGTLTNGTEVAFSVGGTATGVTIAAIGSNIGGSPPGAFLQFQAQIASQGSLGINFNSSSRPAVVSTGKLIRANGESCATGIDFVGSKFTSSAAHLPVDSGSTAASVGLILQAQGGFANAGEAIRIVGSGAGSSVANGLVFRVSGGIQPISGALIKVVGALSAATGLDLSQGTFSGAAIVLGDGHNLQLGTTTGTKIGTGTTQKIGFYNATPVAKQTGVAVTAAGIHAALVSLGLIGA
jgi:hypothetical protein